MRFAARLCLLALCACEMAPAGPARLTVTVRPGPPPQCDRDGDGHDASGACGGEDCDDRDGSVFPRNAELCNERDDDCDGAVDEGCECRPGSARRCGTSALGTCRAGEQRCNSGSWGPCVGAVAPRTEMCNGLDDDCDGVSDEDLLDACGSCGEAGEEVCGNGLDDDCDGSIDDPGLCNVHCAGVEGGDLPAELACCLGDPETGAAGPAAHEFRCTEAEGLESCDTRPCLEVVPGTPCQKAGWLCGRATLAGPVPDPGCGFPSPCSRLDCDDRQGAPCYGGPPQTLGRGTCRAGVAPCETASDGGRSWGSCVGQVLPAAEVCGNATDDDCDGWVDEDDGSGAPCAGPPCLATTELCNGQDDDCDGMVDEECRALGAEQPCYAGPPHTRGLGECRDGIQRAQPDGFWGPCVGSVLPAAERCADGLDSSCNGFGGGTSRDDAGCDPSEETCNGLDDDGDGLVDEDLPLTPCGACDRGTCAWVEPADLGNCARPGRSCSGVREDEITGGLVQDPGKAPTSAPLYVAAGHDMVRMDERIGPDHEVLREPDGIWTQVRVTPAGSAWAILAPACGEVECDGMPVELVHLADAGSCRHDLLSLAGLAVDTAGGAWVVTCDGTCARARLVHVSATCERTQLGPEGDLELGSLLPTAGLDGNGQVWIAGVPGWRGNPDARTFVEAPGLRCITSDDAGTVYGRAPGSGRIVVVKDPWREGTSLPEGLEGDETGLLHGCPVAAADGGLWGAWMTPLDAAKGRGLVRIDAAAGTRQVFPLPAELDVAGAAWSVVETADGAIWLFPGQGGPARLGPDGWTAFEELWTGPIRDVDGGALVRRLARRTGRWTQDLDGGSPSARWLRLDWEHAVPAGASVEVYVAAGARPSDLESGARCGPFLTPPVDLAKVCPELRGRYVRVHVVMRASGAPPRVRGIRILVDR